MSSERSTRSCRRPTEPAATDARYVPGNYSYQGHGAFFKTGVTVHTVGSRAGVGEPARAAVRVSVRKLSRFLCCLRQVSAMVSRRSTRRMPRPRWERKLVFLQITPERSARSASLLVGSTPSCRRLPRSSSSFPCCASYGGVATQLWRRQSAGCTGLTSTWSSGGIFDVVPSRRGESTRCSRCPWPYSSAALSGLGCSNSGEHIPSSQA